MSPLKNTGIAAIALSLALGLAGCGGEEEKLTLTDSQEQEVADRLAPVGEVVLEGDVAAAAPVAIAPAAPRTGEEVYSTKCFTCHGTGAAGAPKIGDAGAWSGRISQGIDTLYASAINGVRGMPPKGLCMDCSDDELKGAVDHMVENSK